MDKTLDNLDWTLLRSFVAVADTGSYSAAGRALGLTQPTVGRHMELLEQATGLRLLERDRKGMRLTPAGQRLLQPARAMREAAHGVSLAAAGADDGLAGTVRITASIFASHHSLPPLIADLRRMHPEIDVELVASDQSENLLYREADIAVRMYRPRQLDVIAKRIGAVELGLFAAHHYVARAGRPESFEDLLGYDFVGYDRNEAIIQGFRDAGTDVSREFFAVRCDHQTTYWELVRAGCGLGFGQRAIGEADPSLVEIDVGLEIPPLEVWLTAHQSLRHTPRVARVWEVLADGLRPWCDAPAPAA